MINLAEETGRYGSVAIAGLAKNTGKTVTLNHLLRESHRLGIRTGTTSIGIDGETTDQVTHTGKPEIYLPEGAIFATSELHYRHRQIESEILDVGSDHTALGRVVTAKALGKGKILLSGPPDGRSVKNLISRMHLLGAETVLIDGALSRLSMASPDITDALVLATGAALSPDINSVVRQTRFVCDLMEIQQIPDPLRQTLLPLTAGIWSIGEDEAPERLPVESTAAMGDVRQYAYSRSARLYAAGLVTDSFIKYLASHSRIKETTLIIRDFTKLFALPATLRAFEKRGGTLLAVNKPRLLAVTVNPRSPGGYSLNPHRLVGALQKDIKAPVIYIDLNDF